VDLGKDGENQLDGLEDNEVLCIGTKYIKNNLES